MSEQSPRRTAGLDGDWKFHLGDIPAPVANKHIAAYMANKAGWAAGAAGCDFDDSDWPAVAVPHDWSIEGQFDRANHMDNGFLPRGIGWYRRHLRLGESDRGKYLALRFDGVATHCTVAVNGHILHRNFCGYLPFTVDFTDVAKFGEEVNVVAVRVDATPIEGWWYEGAGIYRDVQLIKTSLLYIDTHGVHIAPRRLLSNAWESHIKTTLINASEDPKTCRLTWKIENTLGQIIAENSATATVAPRNSLTVTACICLQDPILWSLENPYLYRLKTIVTEDDRIVDEESTNFGFRTIRFDPDHGCFLNDQPVKLKGTCNHQDHAGVGVAVPDSIHEFRIRRLLDMGSNAYRCAHNPPAPALLDACDRLGMLVIDENRNFGSSPEHLEQLRTMVRRDRNHPCIVAWSICNEEAIQGTPAGANIARTMQHVVKQLDHSLPVTAAVSGGLLNDNCIADAIEVVGINYLLHLHDAYHAKHPRVPIYASETHCVLATRGVYEARDADHVFATDDSRAAPWGKSARDTWTHLASRPFVAGAFAWTGFDYRGEPTPHEWPCVNSHFGIMDMCGFPKDAFFLHKAFFTSERFIHLFPHWNWPGHEGQPIIVFAYTNQPWVELFLNGQSFGKQRVNSTCTAMWTVPYQPGTLNAVAYDTEKGEQSATDTVRTSGPATALVLEIHSSFDATTIPADGAFAIPITVFAVDAEGAPVPTADNLVAFSIKGPAKILGVGNGNPTCHEPDKASERSLFNGLAQIIIQTAKTPGGIELTATTDGLKSATLRFDSTQSLNRPSVPAARPRYLVTGWRMSPISSDRPDVTQPAMEQDVNSWDRIDPAAGPQEAWKRASGYAIYRAEAKPPKILKATGGQIVFHEIVGQADVYLDGVAVATKSDPRAGQIVVPIPSGLDRITLSAILHATTCPAGITQCVEILEPGK